MEGLKVMAQSIAWAEALWASITLGPSIGSLFLISGHLSPTFL